MKRCLVLPAIFAVALPSAGLAQNQEPSLQINGSYHLRYEQLNNPFRANQSGSDQLLAARLLLSFKAEQDNLFGEFELQDSRTWLDDAGTPLGTDDVNTADALQLYAGWRDSSGPDDSFSIRGGRMAFDIGSRRFFSRARFRNSYRAFTGVHADWHKADWQWEALYVLPVEARPFSRQELDRNEHEFDREQSNVRFWGLHSTWTGWEKGALDASFFSLEEEDRSGQPTRDRDIQTLALRWLKAPAVNEWDFEVEGAVQTGTVRATAAASDVIDLDHDAYMLHAHVGYRFADNWASRLVLRMDYVTGDKNPDDDESNRFDGLYGSNPVDFGITGIYGAYARANIVSPILKWEFTPRAGYSMELGYRASWVEEENDAHTTSNVLDTLDQTNAFLGHQLEMRLRFSLSEHVLADLGGAYLHKGDLLRNAANAADAGNTAYWYAQFTYQL